MSIWFMLFKYGGELMILHVCLKCLLQGMTCEWSKKECKIPVFIFREFDYNQLLVQSIYRHST